MPRTFARYEARAAIAAEASTSSLRAGACTTQRSSRGASASPSRRIEAGRRTERRGRFPTTQPVAGVTLRRVPVEMVEKGLVRSGPSKKGRPCTGALLDSDVDQLGSFTWSLRGLPPIIRSRISDRLD
jgi:hypothetical protein